MQLVFADEPLRLLCSTQDLLVRAFGPAWRSAVRCLKLLEIADTLADVAAFAALVVYRVFHTIERALEFIVESGPIQLRLRPFALTPGPGERGREREELAQVRAVSIVSVTLAPTVIRA